MKCKNCDYYYLDENRVFNCHYCEDDGAPPPCDEIYGGDYDDLRWED